MNSLNDLNTLETSLKLVWLKRRTRLTTGLISCGWLVTTQYCTTPQHVPRISTTQTDHDMPRINERRLLIDWFLSSIERHETHLQYGTLKKFLQRRTRDLRHRIQERKDDGTNSEISITMTCTISSTEQNRHPC